MVKDRVGSRGDFPIRNIFHLLPIYVVLLFTITTWTCQLSKTGPYSDVGIGMCSYLEDKEVDVGVGSPNFEADSRGKGESWGVLGPGVNYFLA